MQARGETRRTLELGNQGRPLQEVAFGLAAGGGGMPPHCRAAYPGNCMEVTASFRTSLRERNYHEETRPGEAK